MKCIRLICLIGAILWTGVQADGADDIILRTSIKPTTGMWVGQKVILYVDVLAKDGWAQIKKVRDVDVPGAIALSVETQGTRNSDTIEGAAYSGQRYEVLLFAQRGGAILVPAVAVDVEVKTFGAGGGSKIHRMKTPPLEFQARIPPGASKAGGLVSTTRLSLEQTWEPEPGTLKVGDAIKRTVVIEAADVTGMAFAPFRHDEIVGVGVYPSEPDVSERVNRGELISGKRVETVTYVFLEQGAVTLPAIKVAWWNLEQKRMMLAELPALDLKIAANPAAAGTDPDVTAASSRLAWVTPAIVATLVLLALALLRARFDVLKAGLRRWRAARHSREITYFRKVLWAARARDHRTTLAALMAWLDRRAPDNEVGSLETFLSTVGIPKLTEQVRALEAHVCVAGAAASSAWSPQRFCGRLRMARRVLDQETRRHTRVHASPVPALNPQADTLALPTVEKPSIIAEV